MSGTLWKIARQSKQGRKKENRALFFVLFFLFFLTAAGITWFSAAGKVQEEELYSAFGEWKAAYYGADEAQRDQLLENPATSRSGVSAVVGSVIAPDAEERLEDLEQEFAFMYMGSEVPEVTLERMGRDVLALESEAEVMEYLGFSAVLGTLDEGTCELGRISLASGAYPQAEDEIAVVRSSLTRMGYGAELGQTIQVEVYSPGSETVTKEYRLCGILEPYGGGWNTKTYPLVSAVITPEAAEQYPWEPSYNVFLDYAGSVSESPYIYGLNEESMESVSHFAMNVDAYGYDEEPRDYSDILVILLIIFLMFVLVISQLMASQIKKRSRQVGLLKAIGATTGQVEGIFLRELSLVPVWQGGSIPIRGDLTPKTRHIRPMKTKKKYAAGRLAAGKTSGLMRCGCILLMAITAGTALAAAWQIGQTMRSWKNLPGFQA